MPLDERFREGDRVTKCGRGGAEEAGRVMTLRSRAGDAFFMVWILTGPRKNQREYPKLGWRVALDYPNGTLAIVCAGCSREFRIRVPDQVGEVLCAQCNHKDEPVGGEGWIGSDAWKRRHLGKASA